MEVMGILGVAVTLILSGANAAFFLIMKFNDFVHLEKRVVEILNKIDAIDKKLDDKSERLAQIEGKCKANHKD
jgi:hypothetical protein